MFLPPTSTLSLQNHHRVISIIGSRVLLNIKNIANESRVFIEMTPIAYDVGDIESGVSG